MKMKNPYKNALDMPAFLDVAFLVKKETVSGIIGNTQGVSNAINPPRNPIKKRLHKLFDVLLEPEAAWSPIPQLLMG